MNERGNNMKFFKQCSSPFLAATLCMGTALGKGDGSTEKGFVPPPVKKKLPSAPPRTVSSAESFVACCCCVTPMSRSEAKKPPKPPTLVTKLKEE
jgi:hypothetical protein